MLDDTEINLLVLVVNDLSQYTYSGKHTTVAFVSTIYCIKFMHSTPKLVIQLPAYYIANIVFARNVLFVTLKPHGMRGI